MPRLASGSVAVALLVAGSCVGAAAQGASIFVAGVQQFLDRCGTAVSDPESYVASLSQRAQGDLVHWANTPDNSTLSTTVLNGPDLQAGRGIAEQAHIAVVGASRVVTCHMLVTDYRITDTDVINAEVIGALQQLRPGAVRAGGRLPDDGPMAQFNNMFGGYLYHVSNWATEPDQIMSVTIWEGELQLTAFRQQGGQQ